VCLLQSFINLNTPYDAHHADYMEDTTSDWSKRCPNQPFRPSSMSEARETIKVDYYLNSKTAADKAAERSQTLSRAMEQKQQFSQMTTDRRGKMLVEEARPQT
jgi:hypothetical protein